jgi:hypothetical protein
LASQQSSSSFHTHRNHDFPAKTKRTASLNNLFGTNIDFEIEIEKRPPEQPKQPTVVTLDQATRAIVTTSKDGRVAIQNINVHPGNTVVIHSDFHPSDRSSDYVSSDEFRSQFTLGNDSSDEHSLTAAHRQYLPTTTTHTRRYRANESASSKLPSHYRSRSAMPKSSDQFDQVSELVHQYCRSSSNRRTNFNDTIDQIDALYNNVQVQVNGNENLRVSMPYDFSKSSSSMNQRKESTTNTSEHGKRYTSVGFQTMESSSYENLDSRHRHPLRDDRTNSMHSQHQWTSSSLTDLDRLPSARPSQSLSSSGILTDYVTPGSASPMSGFGSTQDLIAHQNRFNDQSHAVHRNRIVTNERTPTRMTHSKWGR